MAQYLKELDRWMTEREFTRVTGINNKTPIQILKTLFLKVDMETVFADLYTCEPPLINMIGSFSPDEYTFINKVFEVRHLIEGAQDLCGATDKLIELCERIDTYLLHQMHRKLLRPMTFGDSHESLTDEDGLTCKYHNVALSYIRLCNFEIENSIVNIYNILKQLNFNCVDQLTEFHKSEM